MSRHGFLRKEASFILWWLHRDPSTALLCRFQDKQDLLGLRRVQGIGGRQAFSSAMLLWVRDEGSVLQNSGLASDGWELLRGSSVCGAEGCGPSLLPQLLSASSTPLSAQVFPRQDSYRARVIHCKKVVVGVLWAATVSISQVGIHVKRCTALLRQACSLPLFPCTFWRSVQAGIGAHSASMFSKFKARGHRPQNHLSP